jgi:hypothetical protein
LDSKSQLLAQPIWRLLLQGVKQPRLNRLNRHRVVVASAAAVDAPISRSGK